SAVAPTLQPPLLQTVTRCCRAAISRVPPPGRLAATGHGARASRRASPMTISPFAETPFAPLGLALVEVEQAPRTEAVRPRSAAPERLDGLDLLLSAVSPTRRRVRRGEYLYRYGDPFHSLFGIRAGSFKSVLLTEDGREQV